MSNIINFKYIVLHHSVTPGDYQTGKNIIKNQEKKYGKNSTTNSYHYMVTKDGNIIPWKSTQQVVGHTGIDGYPEANFPCNYNSLAVCLLGNYEKEEVTTKQYEALLILLKNLSKQYNIKKIIGHRDIIPTICPGINVYKIIPKIMEVLYMDWRQEILNWAIQKGIIKNPEAHKDLDTYFTKAEILAILKNIIDKLEIDLGG